MSTKSEKKSRSVRIKTSLDRHLEELAKEENRSVNNLIETLLVKASGFKEPNEEAKEAINKSREERRELKGFADMQKLFEDLVN